MDADILDAAARGELWQAGIKGLGRCDTEPRLVVLRVGEFEVGAQGEEGPFARHADQVVEVRQADQAVTAVSDRLADRRSGVEASGAIVGEDTSRQTGVDIAQAEQVRVYVLPAAAFVPQHGARAKVARVDY